jgi:hypothetical protein
LSLEELLVLRGDFTVTCFAPAADVGVVGGIRGIDEGDMAPEGVIGGEMKDVGVVGVVISNFRLGDLP